MTQDINITLFNIGDYVRVGSVVDTTVYDLNRCYANYLAAQKRVSDATLEADRLVPSDLSGFLSGGASALKVAREALAWYLSEKEDGASHDAVSYDIGEVNILAPIIESTKVICMEVMYRTHVAMVGLTEEQRPKYPTYFTKLSQVAVGPDEFVIIPKAHAGPFVYGTELTVVIGKTGRSIPVERVDDHIWGYTILNDVTVRGQSTGSGGKVFDTSAPIGPWIVPKDQIADPHDLAFSFRLNGKEVQKGNTSDLLFPIQAMVSEVSKWFTLNPGDIIATGDVGATESARPGDVMEAEIEGIGVLRNPVKSED